MKTFTVTEQQILKYNMQDEFPELFNLETHRWYLVSHPSPSMRDAIVFLREEDVSHTFGFNHDGEWTDVYNNENLHTVYRKDIIRPATIDEVRRALIDEAKRRGVWDVPMLSATNKSESLSRAYAECFDYSNWLVLWSEYGRVFDNGEWATVLELTTEQRLERIEKHLGL